MGKNRKWTKKQVMNDDEPEGMLSGLGSTRTASVSSRKRGASPTTLYDEDIGDIATKKIKPCTFLGNDIGKLKVTKDEKRRRQERELRFAASSGSTVKAKDPEAALFGALSSPRVLHDTKEQGGGGNGKKGSKNKKIGQDGGNGFVGTSQSLEKQYLRLTTFPKSQDVRPLAVLKQSLAHIKSRYLRDEDFEWANDQFKSLRQDITVQGIKNDFVLEVYETHARLVLEQGALNEFNQCQTMIKSLTMGIDCSVDEFEATTGKSKKRKDKTRVLLKQKEAAADEFGSYRLLYALVQKEWGDVSKELKFATSVMKKRDQGSTAAYIQQSSQMSSCAHAVMVTKAVIHDDYHAFFHLYDASPHLSAYLMDYLVQRVRFSAFQRIVASYRPTLNVEFFQKALLFPDLEETRTFLKKSGAVFIKEKGAPALWIDCKATVVS
mmetsp:Transcript_5008/g.8800  ORF Transcript_5008/g.8800 Transcript_5008/m.8800 type:complete len:436 (-) Transcript_5008:63-1370(-)